MFRLTFMCFIKFTLIHALITTLIYIYIFPLLLTCIYIYINTHKQLLYSYQFEILFIFNYKINAYLQRVNIYTYKNRINMIVLLDGHFTLKIKNA